MNEREICHTGVKGMKWGVRKKRDITKSKYNTQAKLRKKEIKLLAKKKKSKNMQEVLKKMDDELESSKTYKEGSKFNKKFQADLHTKGVTINQMARLQRYNNQLYKEKQRIADKYKDAYAGAMLKDMKYENTKAGREYIKKFMAD